MTGLAGSPRAAGGAFIQSVDPYLLPAVAGGSNYYDNATFDGGLAGYTTTHLTMTVNRLYATPIVLPAGTYDRMGILVGTAAAGKKARVMLYTPGTNGLPGTLLLDPGTDLAMDTGAGTPVEHTISLTLGSPRLLIAAVWSDGAPVLAGWPTPGRNWWGSTSGSVGRQAMLYRDGLTYGSGPATFGTPTAYVGSSVPRIRFRAA